VVLAFCMIDQGIYPQRRSPEAYRHRWWKYRPSTVMRLNDSLTAAETQPWRLLESTEASVATNDNKVAMSGRIMQHLWRCRHMSPVREPRRILREHPLGTVSVVMIPCAASPSRFH